MYTEHENPLTYDPKEARRLLAGAGFGPDHPLEIELLAPNVSRYRRMLDSAMNSFAPTGIRLTTRQMEWGALMKRRADGEFDGIMMMWYHDALGIDPHEFFHSNPSGAEAGHNYMRYQNPDVDHLLVKARETLDTAKRNDLYHQLNHRLHDDQPITLLVHETNTLLLHKRFRGVKVGKTGVSPERWWVREPERLHDPGKSP